MGRRWHRRVADSLKESLLVADGWIQQPAVAKELAECARTGRASRRLWYLWVLEEWLRVERGASRAGGEAVALSRSALRHAGYASSRRRSTSSADRRSWRSACWST
jgi:hypothetical protein